MCVGPLRDIPPEQFCRGHNIPLTVLNLDVPDEVILGRISDRWVHLPSGRIYNMSYNRPKVESFDDVTGEPLTKRPDDHPVSRFLHIMRTRGLHAISRRKYFHAVCSSSMPQRHPFSRTMPRITSLLVLSLCKVKRLTRFGRNSKRSFCHHSPACGSVCHVEDGTVSAILSY